MNQFSRQPTFNRINLTFNLESMEEAIGEAQASHTELNCGSSVLNEHTYSNRNTIYVHINTIPMRPCTVKPIGLVIEVR